MDSLISSERGALASLSDAPSLVFLLERALENLQCGHYTEGIVFLALAREQLVPNQNDLATALDTFLQRYAGYQLVQQTLLEACIHFAKADVEQKACVNDMLGMLPTLIRGSASFDYPPNLQTDTNNTPKQFSSFLSIQSPREVFFSYASPAEDDAPLPPLSVTCFGRFEVKCQSRSVTLCSNRSGRAILRYLVAKPGHCASSDTLLSVPCVVRSMTVLPPILEIVTFCAKMALTRLTRQSRSIPMWRSFCAIIKQASR